MQIKKSTSDYGARLIDRVKRINKLIIRENFTKLFLMQPPPIPFFFISNRYNAKASTLLGAINYNVTPLLSNELRYRATIVQSITRILDLLTFRSHDPYTYVYQNIWKKNSLTTDSPFSISRQRPTGTVESTKQIKRKGSFIDHTFLSTLSLRKFVAPFCSPARATVYSLFPSSF